MAIKITLTGINFSYTNGFEAGYTGINLSFSSSGATYNVSGFVEVAPDEYMGTTGDIKNLTSLIIKKIGEGLEKIKIALTGINFSYDNGFESGYTGINLIFNSSGASFNIGGSLKVASDEYMATMGDIKNITNLIIKRVKEDVGLVEANTDGEPKTEPAK